MLAFGCYGKFVLLWQGEITSGHISKATTSERAHTRPNKMDPSPATHVQAEASDGLTSIIEVEVEANTASSLMTRQTTNAWKKTLETDKEMHNRAAERRQNINEGHRFYHARCHL